MSQLSQSSFSAALPSWIWVFILLIPLIPISGESLWFDEGTTSYFAGQETLSGVWHQLNTTTFSESQMPGYILYMWGWEKLFGNSEWTLRMSNYPWLLLLLIAAARLPLSRPQRYTALVLIGLSPFVWYNLDEARSTTAILSVGGLALFGLVHYFAGNKRGLYLSMVACIIGLTFNMLFYFAILPLGAYVVFMAVTQKRKLPDLLRDSWPVLGAVALIGGGMLIYYIGTLLRGAGGVKEMPSVSNLGFVAYEFLGFNGLGPSREAMKANLSPDLLLGRLAFMLPMVSFLGGMAFLALRRLSLPKVLTHPLLLSLILGLGSFFVAAYVVQFQFWGRHAVYLYPFFVLYIAYVGEQLGEQEPRWTRWLAGLGLACWLVSCGFVRFAPSYQKRGAREAIAAAAEARPNAQVPLAWTSNWMVGYYYGLDFAETYLPYPTPTTPEAYPADNVPPFSAPLAAEVLDTYPTVMLIWFDAFSGYDKERVMADYVAQRPHKLVAKTRTYRIFLLE